MKVAQKKTLRDTLRILQQQQQQQNIRVKTKRILRPLTSAPSPLLQGRLPSPPPVRNSTRTVVWFRASFKSRQKQKYKTKLQHKPPCDERKFLDWDIGVHGIVLRCGGRWGLECPNGMGWEGTGCGGWIGITSCNHGILSHPIITCTLLPLALHPAEGALLPYTCC